jgi:hypothetical protein
MARAGLIGARDRAKKMSPDKRVMRLRVGTFINVLSQPAQRKYYWTQT